jgi:Lon-like ATP-dependent protease
VEGDSASISIATAVISVLEGISIKQNVAMIGSLSIRGEVLPIGGVNAKVIAAYKAKIRNIIIPESNKEDLVIPKEIKSKVKIMPVKTIWEVIDIAFKNSKKKKELQKKIKKLKENKEIITK